MVRSTASTFRLAAAPCDSTVCCTVVVCNNWQTPCYFSFSSTFFPAPLHAANATRSASPSPTPGAAGSSSATHTPPATPQFEARASNSPRPRPLPTLAPGADWWPLAPGRYAVCYTSAPTSQGACSSAHAHAAAAAVSIALCRAAIDAGTAPARAFLQVSPLSAMADWLAAAGPCNGTTPGACTANPCGGGSVEALLLAFALDVSPALRRGALALLTCTQATLGSPCSGGCDPYTAGACSTGAAGGTVNPAGLSSASPACSALFLGRGAGGTCANGGPLDVQSAVLTARASALAPLLSASDPLFAAAPLTTTGGSASASAVPSGGWSPRDIDSVKSYLRARGPLAVTFTLCADLVNYMAQAQTCGLVGSVMTLPSTDGLFCTARLPFTGAVANPAYAPYPWVAPLFDNSATRQPYAGPSCSPSNSLGSHTALLVGWRTAPDAFGVPTACWVVRNSWGPAVGDAGHHYFSIAAASLPAAPVGSVGSMALASPVGLAFVPPHLGSPGSRALGEAAQRESGLRRRLAALAARGAPHGTGLLADCSSDAGALREAAVLAKGLMDASAAAPLTGFVVSTLQCQLVGASTIFKAAVSAIDAVSGNRAFAHVTFQHYPAGAPAAAAEPPPLPRQLLASSRLLQVQGNSSSSSLSSAKNGMQVLLGSSVTAVIPPSAAGTASSAAPPSTSILLSFTPLQAAQAPADASFAVRQPLTNPGALVDPLQELIGLRASTALVITALVVLGCTLGVALVYAVYFCHHHYHIFSHIRERWDYLEEYLQHSHIFSHIRERWDYLEEYLHQKHLKLKVKEENSSRALLSVRQVETLYDGAQPAGARAGVQTRSSAARAAAWEGEAGAECANPGEVQVPLKSDTDHE